MQIIQKPLVIIGCFLILCIGLITFGNKVNESKAHTSNNSVAKVTDVKGTGTPKLGGNFTLIDHKGAQRQGTDFRGKFMLVYFGYSFCPDVCPAALSNITKALNQIGNKATEVQPLFITLDPERDQIGQLATYVQNFHPSLIALTGTTAQVKDAQKMFRVYAAKAQSDGSSTEYAMNHSSIIYLMDRQGRMIAHFNHTTPSEDIAQKLKQVI